MTTETPTPPCCPRCGSKREYPTVDGITTYECGTQHFDASPGCESELCRRNQAVAKLERELTESRAELAAARAWTDDDQPLPEDDAIIDAGPPLSHDPKTFSNFIEAIRLVSAKRSKYALIDLVNWILVREERQRLRADKWRKDAEELAHRIEVRNALLEYCDADSDALAAHDALVREEGAS